MIKRRNFLQLSGAGLLPLLASSLPAFAADRQTISQAVNFAADGPEYTPDAYLKKLQQISGTNPIHADVYGQGGVVKALEEKIAQLTGKEAAVLVPTGTMANQMALHLLSGERTKVYLPETSHIFRDEADAAQSVYGKRLIPLAQGEPCFTLAQLQAAIAYDDANEVFKSGIGAVAIENPVRRCDGRQIPLEELQNISAFCRQNQYPLHLDGARLFLAAAASGHSIADYAQLFDTVYLSLYKYMGAGGGAILAGPKELIAKMPHLIKIHGGTIYNNWANAAMALAHLDGLGERLQKTLAKAKELFSEINRIPGCTITSLPGGTNIYHLKLAKIYNGRRFSQYLREKQILIRNPDTQGIIRLQANESLLPADSDQLLQLFTAAMGAAKTS